MMVFNINVSFNVNMMALHFIQVIKNAYVITKYVNYRYFITFSYNEFNLDLIVNWEKNYFAIIFYCVGYFHYGLDFTYYYVRNYDFVNYTLFKYLLIINCLNISYM